MFAEHRNGAGPPMESLRISPKQEDDADELAIFSGQNRGLISRMPPVTPPSASSQRSQLSRSSANREMLEMPDVHPSLMEYIYSVPQAGTVNHEASNYFFASCDQPLPTGVPNLSHFMPISSFEMSADLPSEEVPHQVFSTAFPHNSTSVDHLQQLYAETLATDTQGALNSANGMNDDWMMFLKDSGI